MAEQEIFEARLRTALARRVADGPTDFDALEFARSVAAAEPRRHGRATLRAGSLVGFPPGRSPAVRLAWALAAAALLVAATVAAVFVGSELLRHSDELTVVPPPAVDLTVTAHPDGVIAVAWSPDGARIATVGSNATARIWDATTGEELATLRLTEPEGSLGARARMAFSGDGGRLAVGMHVYDAATGAELVTLPGQFMAYSPDGTRIATSEDAGWVVKFRVCDAATGDVLLELRPWRSNPSATIPLAMAWSPDGGRLAIPWRTQLETWDTATGERLAIRGRDEDPFVYWTDVAWDPDGTRIATAGGREIAATWDADAGAELATFPGQTAIEWSPDGTRIATAGSGGTGRIWDAATGAELSALTGHGAKVTDVAWSPDGSRLATASDDGTARIWQVGTAVAPAPGATPAPIATPVALAPLVLEPLGGPTVSDTSLGVITWQRYASEYGFLGVTGTPHGPVASGSDFNELRWLGRDGTWDGLALPWVVPPLTWDGEDLYTSGSGRPRRLSWDGGRWDVGDVLEVPDAVRPVDLVATGPRGTIVVGGDDLAIARDGQHFVDAAPAPVDDWPFVLATTDGFVALYPTDPARWDMGEFEPIPWFTADGGTWEQAAAASPFGEEARIDGVAGREGRFVAVGHVGGSEGPWAAWLSGDGVAWERVLDVGLGRHENCGSTDSFCPVGVTAGDAGWVIYSKDGSAWASTDGRTWEPISDWPAVRGEGMATPQVVLAGKTIVLVGNTDTGGSDLVIGTIERPDGGG